MYYTSTVMTYSWSLVERCELPSGLRSSVPVETAFLRHFEPRKCVWSLVSFEGRKVSWLLRRKKKLKIWLTARCTDARRATHNMQWLV